MTSSIFFVSVVALATASVFQMNIRSSGSLRARLFKEGRLAEWVASERRSHQRGLGSQPLHYDEFYLGNLTLGTPPQLFTNMILDTGHADLWVIDSQCTSTECMGTPNSFYSKKHFDGSKSSTYKTLSTPFSYQDGQANARGHLGIDTLTFGGLTSATQTFGIATEISYEFGEMPIDGVMGLGWPAISVFQAVPPLQNVLSQLDAPLFTIWLDLLPFEGVDKSHGMITYGAVDNANCDMDLQFVPLTAESYWQFSMDKVSIGSYTNTAKQQAISASGTPWLGALDADINGVAANLGALYIPIYDVYLIDCNATAPDLMLTISGGSFNIPAADCILDIGYGDGKCVATLFKISGGGFGPSWILGDTFVRTYCTVYDIGSQRIGFAKAKHSII